MNSLDRAKLESYVDGLCGGQYTPAGNSFIIVADINPENIKSAFASREESITLLPLENKTQSYPFGRFLVEEVTCAKTFEDLLDIAKAIAAISNSEIVKIGNERIKLISPELNEDVMKDINDYIKLHPEVELMNSLDGIYLSFK